VRIGGERGGGDGEQKGEVNNGEVEGAKGRGWKGWRSSRAGTNILRSGMGR